ncbi:inorganic phosphate transporter [Umezakia ovalisporum]|jgi:PiT family inorganic phosphate transporter|uniref:Phosphate transporter n=2 Tax=Umezakia ovalisporum TaxID=75695 RepID=A0AA43GZW9_9CYAN|nr:inorganic phosphate transporter [Umezakia ovalisporum]MBI1242320.1 inorganic phosphate transporter [Nostoc sp. RI_552]MDH6056270.1 inorganic phosphate transporter [Umezakia ovalisporum FSS-43]MDH6064576.1 inorganic phosphate transporter [Umezakia ovalisporum FSS-62]MDH6067774.1 inorganic phosphate transporter [Umezakia ovalisporum APH033B]MDH6070918.1 inorganic phosphate transporter [Umezakia ovalisporum CobakiLakeA]
MPITLISTSLLAFYLAWNLGANDVANSMGTSVGSQALSLRQAIIIAGILEFTGAVLFGQEVSQTLATKIANPVLFAATPEIYIIGMVTVLVTCGLWLQIATSGGLPVASSHAVVGAMAGFSWVAMGVDAINWISIGLVAIGWIVTPILSSAIAALFYGQIKHWILEQPNQLAQLQQWIPWLSVIVLGVFGVIVLPLLTQPLTNYLNSIGLNLPSYDLPLFVGAVAAIVLSVISWRQLQEVGNNAQKLNNEEIIFTPVEQLFARFQVLSACFVAFAHGSNDVGNAIAPLAAIVYINSTGTIPVSDITIPLWILILGGAGIVAGLAVWGQKVINTIGENIISLQPSGGFCAELATAITILLASRLGLPVSTSHALVGGVIGIGLVQNIKSIQFTTLQSIAVAWLMTFPVSAIFSVAIFTTTKILFL